MSLATMVLLGVVLGFVANKLVLRSGQGLLRDLGLAAAGAVATGGLLNLVGTREASEADVFGLVVALAGAAAALILYHMFHRPVPAR